MPPLFAHSDQPAVFLSMFSEGRIDWFGNYDEIAYERFARNGEDDGYMKPWYDPSLLVKLTEDMPRISAGVDKWAVLANGGLKCNSVPIQVQRWPFIIQQCERPISARYLAFVDTGYVNDPIFNRIRKVYVSGKGKHNFQGLQRRIGSFSRYFGKLFFFSLWLFCLT